ncbi:helix-turn-helix domain-containing protein [Actinophytocola sediminis]
MQDQEPTIRSRELGDGLRLAMERAQLNGKQVATRLGWSPSRVSRLLTGRRGADELELASFLGLCGVKGSERKRLLNLCREQDTRSWFQQFGSRIPKQVRTYVDHENRATTITDFKALVMPGILQTDEYARALFARSATVPANEIDDRVVARAGRKTIFSRHDRPECAFLIHEFVLRLPVGDHEVMSEQLHHLLRMTVRPYITIRVIPAAFGAHAGLAGSFILLESHEYKPVVYLEGETSGVFLEKPEEIAAYRDVVKELASAALDEAESKELIATVAIEQYADREDHHDQA